MSYGSQEKVMAEKKILGFTLERVPEDKRKNFTLSAHINITDEFGEVLDHALPNDSTDVHIYCWISGYMAGRRTALNLIKSATESAVMEIETRISVAEQQAKS